MQKLIIWLAVIWRQQKMLFNFILYMFRTKHDFIEI